MVGWGVKSTCQAGIMSSSPIPSQHGRRVLITGANSGLGLLTAEALAAAGAEVFLACRNPTRAEEARQRVAVAATGPEPRIVQLDLADLDSVAKAADEIATKVDTLDVLVNNAGIMAPPLSHTAQGFETQFGVNHLGHFALTGRLLPLLLAAQTSRVVTVSSGAHLAGWMHWDDLDARRNYFSWTRYGQSKLANLLFTKELARRATEHDTGLVAVAAHPGYAATNLSHNGPANSGTNRFMALATGVTDRFIAQSAEDGVVPQIHAATTLDADPDDYFGPDGLLGQRGKRAKKVGRSTFARNGEDARRLWEVSTESTGVDYAWPEPG